MQFTAGCKFQAGFLNYDPSVDLNSPDLCIAGIAGCIDANATNTNTSANADCTYQPINNINATGCCCYGCETPEWDTTNPVVVSNWVTDTNVPPNTYAQQLTFNFDDVDDAVYSLSWTNQANTQGGVLMTNAIATVSGTTASIVYTNNNNTIFLDGNAYVFTLTRFCSNENGDSCGQASAQKLVALSQ